MPTPRTRGVADDAAPPQAPADPRAEKEEVWLVEFRNSAGHTVARATYDAHHTTADIPDRVEADLEIYFSWLVKDALVRREHSAYTAVVVANPTHTRVRTDLDRTRGQGQSPERGDG